MKSLTLSETENCGKTKLTNNTVLTFLSSSYSFYIVTFKRWDRVKKYEKL